MEYWSGLLSLHRCKKRNWAKVGNSFGKQSRGVLQTTGFGHEQPSRLRANSSFKEETNISELRYPNESREYRDAPESLLKDEQELVDKVKSEAEQRRNPRPDGQLRRTKYNATTSTTSPEPSCGCR